ncbi:hypothetical protein FD754_023836, partial [Muntiacus muntjak]
DGYSISSKGFLPTLFCWLASHSCHHMICLFLIGEDYVGSEQVICWWFLSYIDMNQPWIYILPHPRAKGQVLVSAVPGCNNILLTWLLLARYFIWKCVFSLLKLSSLLFNDNHHQGKIDFPQVECHPYLNQSKLLEFCKSHDIVLVAYGALGAQRTLQWQSWSQLNNASESPEEICNHRIGGDIFEVLVNPNFPFLLEDPVLSAIAKKHKQTPALVALRYQIQRGVVVLAKSYNKKRIKENIQVFDFELTPEDMKAIDGLNSNIRYYDFQQLGFFPKRETYRCFRDEEHSLDWEQFQKFGTS